MSRFFGCLMCLVFSVASAMPLLQPKEVYLNFDANSKHRVRYAFPTNFLFGTSSSAYQIEGHNTRSDWAAWEKLGKNEDNQKVGAGTDHWNRMSEDVKLLKQLGMKSYRFSIEWSRLEIKPGVWDQEAIGRYASFVRDLQNEGIVPMITLMHFTLPKWLADRGGILADEFVGRFMIFTSVVSKRIAPRVSYFVTFNEPMVPLLGAYVEGTFPPGHKNDFKSFFRAEVQVLRAHAEAYRILKSNKGGVRRRVGMSHSLIKFKPKTEVLDSWLSSAAHDFFNRSFLDALIKGEFKQTIPAKGRIRYDLSTWQNASIGRRAPSRAFTPLIDFIGVNTYSIMYLSVKWFDGGLFSVARSGKTNKQFSHGGDLDPLAIYQVLKWLDESYPGVDIHITESGYNGSDDSIRRAYILEVLAYCSRAISEGVRLKGLQYWSFIDSFEWLKGWKPKDSFGLVAFDHKTYERQPKASAKMYSEIIRHNGFVSLPLKDH